MRPRDERPPLTAVMLLATAIGIVAGLLIGQALAGQAPGPAPVPEITLILPTIPPTATATRTPAPTATRTPSPSPTPSPVPWRFCIDAQPGELCIPSRVLTPTPTPTFPPCSSGQTRMVGGVELCELDATPVSGGPKRGERW